MTDNIVKIIEQDVKLFNSFRKQPPKMMKDILQILDARVVEE